MTNTKIGILGGGLTGLTVAHLLKCSYEILEKESECGGLCRSITENGFTFDYGGAHAFFSKDKETLNLILKILGENSVKSKRNAKVFFSGKYIKYPFENGLSELPPEDNFECLYHYVNGLLSDRKKPENFEEWLYYSFGKGIAEKYLIPYNNKIWNYDLKNMGIDFVEKTRIPQPPLKDILKSSLGIETEGFLHQLYFYYPEHGGTQAFIKSLEKDVTNVVRNFDVKKIKKAGSQWLVSDGNTEKTYDKLISAIPVFELISALEDVPENIVEAVQSLKYNSLICIMIGLNKIKKTDISWLYVPNKKYKFHKMSFPANYSKFTVPENKSSVMVEITSNKGDGTWEMSDEDLINEAIGGLDEMGIIDKKEVIYSSTKRSKYAYVIYDKMYSKNLSIIKRYLEDIGIELCGRFAEFEYLNMDACVFRAIRLAEGINKNE